MAGAAAPVLLDLCREEDDDAKLADDGCAVGAASLEALKAELRAKRRAIRKAESALAALQDEEQLLELQIQELEEEAETRQRKRNTPDWAGASFAWDGQVLDLLRGTFQLPGFRAKQREVINATLSGYDTLVLMPTGGGKSLVYMLPALAQKGFTLVVSPLISLMHDQVLSR